MLHEIKTSGQEQGQCRKDMPVKNRPIVKDRQEAKKEKMMAEIATEWEETFMGDYLYLPREEQKVIEDGYNAQRTDQKIRPSKTQGRS